MGDHQVLLQEIFRYAGEPGARSGGRLTATGIPAKFLGRDGGWT